MLCCVFFYLNESSFVFPLFSALSEAGYNFLLVKLATTATVAEYMGNYFQTAGNFLRLIFLLGEVLVGSSSFMMDCMALPEDYLYFQSPFAYT